MKLGPISDLILTPFLVSFLIATLITPVIIKLAPRLGILDDPKRRPHPAGLHTKPTPRGGGIPIFFAILLSSLLFIKLEQRLAGILLGAATLTLIGFWDDRKPTLSPYLRLLFQFLAAGLVVASGIGIAFISNPLNGVIDLSQPRLTFELLGEVRNIWILSVIFGFFWMVALMNFVSWSSGVDGQLSGFTGIAALTVGLLSLRFSADITQWPVTILAAVTAGAYFGFLPYHAFPQKIMPGFGGGTLAGFMLAVLSILATAKVGTLLVVLAIPIIDATYTVIRRILAGRSPVWADSLHLHHRLLRAGWTKPKIALFYWAGTAVLAVLVLNLNTRGKFLTMVGAALGVSGLILWLRSFKSSSNHPGQANG